VGVFVRVGLGFVGVIFGVGVGVRHTDLVLVLRLRMVRVGCGRLLLREGVSLGCLLGQVSPFENVDFRAGNAAAVDGLDLQGCAEVHGGGSVVKDLRVDSGGNEGPEKHVSGDAGEAVEIGDAHGGSF